MTKKIFGLGEVSIRTIDKKGNKSDWRPYNNLLVDDGKEYILDFFGGRKNWHLPKDPTAYATGDVGLWTQPRYGAVGICMFNNASSQRVDGINGVPSGGECDYPVSDYILVSPEDSFLSNEVGTRIELDVTRRDQTLEFFGRFNVPGNLPTGTEIREFGLFIGSTGPAHDPSYHDGSKPSTMLCRVALYGSGLCGITGVYTDDPLVATDDVEIRWKFGEI